MPMTRLKDINAIEKIRKNMATVRASELGIERLHHVQALGRKSWDDVAEESFVGRATIMNNVLKGKPVTKETILALATYFKLDRREIVTDREWYPQLIDRSPADLWKMLWEYAREDGERFRVIKAADKPQFVREGISMLGAIPRNRVKKCYSVLLEEKIVFCVDMPIEGHLVLLEREPNGDIVCLSPSQYVRQNKLSVGLSILPQRDNSQTIDAFGANEPGREEWIACLLPNVPLTEFGWLETSRQEALVLEVDELVSLLGCVVEGLHAQLWKLSYEVVNHG
jgi:hypothetical protein